MSAVKNNSWNRSMLPQNFAESLKCYPYTQFIFLLCPYVIKARHPGETGGQATLRQRTCWARILTVEAFPSDRMRGQVTTVSLTPHAPGTPYHGAWNANSPPISSHAPQSTRLLCFEFHLICALSGLCNAQASIRLHLHGPKCSLSPSSAHCSRSPFRGSTGFLNSKSPLSGWPESHCFICTDWWTWLLTLGFSKDTCRSRCFFNVSI